MTLSLIILLIFTIIIHNHDFWLSKHVYTDHACKLNSIVNLNYVEKKIIACERALGREPFWLERDQNNQEQQEYHTLWCVNGNKITGRKGKRELKRKREEKKKKKKTYNGWSWRKSWRNFDIHNASQRHVFICIMTWITSIMKYEWYDSTKWLHETTSFSFDSVYCFVTVHWLVPDTPY